MADQIDTCRNYISTYEAHKPYCASKCIRKNVSHLINKHNINYVLNAVVCVNIKDKMYFYDVHGNLIEKRVFLIKLGTQEITNLLDHNAYTENSFCYKLELSKYYVTERKVTETRYNIYWYLISNTGSTLLNSSINMRSEATKIKVYTILDNCLDPNRNENFLKPCSVSIEKNTCGDYKVNYYGLNKRLLLTNLFPYKISLKNDLRGILNDKRFNEHWCSENLENIKKKSIRLQKSDCVIL
jgi:hypothetical protein